jgi:predicted DNA-binding transcriptional regulator AlpA
VVTVGLDGEITVEADPFDGLPADRLLTTAQVTELLGLSNPSAWRSMVCQGGAPRADDPGDLSAHARRRSPRWSVSTLREWRAERPSASWKRREAR